MGRERGGEREREGGAQRPKGVRIHGQNKTQQVRRKNGGKEEGSP
jgi:hypothetical protein